MNRVFALIAMLVLLVVVGVPVANAQTINDEVRVSAGVTRVEDTNVFTGRGELRKELLQDRVMFNDVFTVDATSDIARVRNVGLVRFAPLSHVFVAAGLGVGKVTNEETTLNPVAQLGANFSFNRVNVEPYVQLDTPDLLHNDDKSRSLSANVNVKFGVTERFGFIGTGQLRSTRFDNRFFDEGFTSLEKTVTGGVYYTW